jgi:hypothetical protein
MTACQIKTAIRDDDGEARERRLRGQILDGIEATLTELAQPHPLSAAIDRAVRAQCAAVLCRHAMCRRARRCRGQPCKALAADSRSSS